MPAAWIDGYYIVNEGLSNVRISFVVPGVGVYPYMIMDLSTPDGMSRFELLKAQLDTNWVWVDWFTTSSVRRIVSLKNF